MTRQTTLTNRPTKCCKTYSVLWQSYSWRLLLKIRSRTSCCLSAVFYSARTCCVVSYRHDLQKYHSNDWNLARRQLSTFNFRTRGFSDLLGVAKTVSRGVQKFSKAVQLPDSRRQVAPWINYKKSGHYSQIWSLHFNDFCCVFCWPTQCSTTKSV